MKEIIIICLVFLNALVFGQQSYNLQDILKIAHEDNWLAKDARQVAEMATLDLDILQASLKPQFSLTGKLPGYYQTSLDIVQPNGVISFQRITQNNSMLSLTGTQQVPLTGAQVFIQSDIRRFDDFTFENSSYNGIPFRIGINQPISFYNPIKWRKKQAEISYKTAQKQFNFDVENSQYQSVFYYFQVLVESENVNIATLNTEVNQRLLNIAEERLELGKISENDKIQMEMELENSKLNLRRSQYALKAAESNLWTFLEGNTSTSASLYDIPETLPYFIVDEELAVQKAMSNRPEFLEFQQRIIESDESIVKAKDQFGPQASLFASFGLARGSEMLGEIYSDPFTEQQLSLTFNLPIIDWGVKRSSVKQAEIQKQNTINELNQQKANIENNVRLKVREFMMLQQTVLDQKEIRSLADDRFDIANERYVLGAISITDWSLAQREKDQSRRSYIQTLRDYWLAYYELRLVTGYDFINNQNIVY